jgi:hypothetical protein
MIIYLSEGMWAKIKNAMQANPMLGNRGHLAPISPDAQEKNMKSFSNFIDDNHEKQKVMDAKYGNKKIGQRLRTRLGSKK